MKILKASTEKEFQEITQFFGKMWKEEFNLDRFDKIDQYKQGTVFFIRDNDIIVSAINIRHLENINHIGRFGTLNEFRGKGYGGKLMKYTLEYSKNNGIKEVNLEADFKRTTLYEKYGFQQIGEKIAVGNTYGIKMIKKL